MAIPLTITASVWNYCQNACKYCVAGSNDSRWNPPANFSDVPPNHLLDFDALINWYRRFVPSAHIHVSGGEPLDRPDIEEQLKKLMNAGITVTVFTNGMSISTRKKLLDMPLRWHVTHHGQNDINHWIDNVSMIKKKPHIATRVIYRCTDAEMAIAEHVYRSAGLNFFWQRLNGLKIGGIEPPASSVIASQAIHLIRPSGNIYPCNDAKRPPIGNIINCSYDPRMATDADRTAMACCCACAAYQTALMCAALTDAPPYDAKQTASVQLSGRFFSHASEVTKNI